MKRKGIFVGLLLTSLLFLSVLVAAVAERSGAGRGAASLKEDPSAWPLRIVTSFYPVYIAAMNLTEDVPGVSLQNLSEPETGCLHDYQLTPSDMILLSTADVFIVNGGGIEEFLTDVAEAYPDLVIIDTAEDIPLLEGETHQHDHDEDGHEDEADHGKEAGQEADHEEEDHEEEEHHHGTNPHVWLSVPRYRAQLQAMKNGLLEADEDPERRALYEENFTAYDKKLQALSDYEEELLKQTKDRPVVLFHAGYEYLCDDLSMEEIFLLDLDEERQISAGEVAEVMAEIREHQVKLVLAEDTYGREMGERVAGETGAEVLYLDTLVRSAQGYDSDAYVNSMTENLKKIEEALQ